MSFGRGGIAVRLQCMSSLHSFKEKSADAETRASRPQVVVGRVALQTGSDFYILCWRAAGWMADALRHKMAGVELRPQVPVVNLVEKKPMSMPRPSMAMC